MTPLHAVRSLRSMSTTIDVRAPPPSPKPFPLSLTLLLAPQAASLTIAHTTAPKPRVEASKLVFGVTTTDHMLDVDWDATNVRTLRPSSCSTPKARTLFQHPHFPTNHANRAGTRPASSPTSPSPLTPHALCFTMAWPRLRA